MNLPADTPVLIVGAGPTGLMLALQLARRGITPIIIDRNPTPSAQTKALGVQARTLEIYHTLGIAERALELGTRAAGATLWAGGRPAAHVPLGDIGRSLSPFPFLLILGQDDNERLLGESLARHAIAIRWSTELVALAQRDGAVDATLRLPDGSTRTLRAAWVAGCDGARSAVRGFCAIDFVGAPYQHVFFVADTETSGPMTPGVLNVFLRREGFHLFFPMRGVDHWRIVGILPPELHDRPNLTIADLTPVLHDAVGTGLRVRACSWLSTYRIHHRRAARFRDRRCFLLGDAAHIHSPVGAQGMNTGLQDATNLAWKLALVVAGHAAPDLLDSYAIEREPIADRLLATTDRAFSLVVSERPASAWFRLNIAPRLLALAMRAGPARRFVFRTISQIGVRYPQSPLSAPTVAAAPRAAPRPGDRFPWLRLRLAPDAEPTDLFTLLDDARFTLVTFDDPPGRPAVGALPDLVVIRAIAAQIADRPELRRAGITPPWFALVRPDGYIACAGRRPDAPAIVRYLRERIGPDRRADARNEHPSRERGGNPT